MKKSFWREKASSGKEENLPRDKLVFPERGNVTPEREKVFLGREQVLSRGRKVIVGKGLFFKKKCVLLERKAIPPERLLRGKRSSNKLNKQRKIIQVS